MEGADRFREMKKLHEGYFPLYREAVESCRSSDSAVKEMLDSFVLGRIGKREGIRAMVFRSMLELASGKGEKEWERALPIIAAVELQLGSTYSFNVAADDKAGYTSPESKETAFKVRDIARELCFGLIDRADIGSKRDDVKEIFRETDEGFYRGEVLDTMVNLYSSLDAPVEMIAMDIPDSDNCGIEQRILDRVSRKLTKTYGKKKLSEVLESLVWQRTYGVNAGMIENYAHIIKVLTGMDDEKASGLGDWGRYYGIGMMIINDVQDFSLDLVNKGTREKNSSDVFSDMRKGKITWPIRHALENPGMRDILDNAYASPEYLEELRKELCRNGPINDSVLDAVAYAKLANTRLEGFPEQEAKYMLRDSAISITKLSKYVRALEDLHGRIRPHDSEVRRRTCELRDYLETNEKSMLELFG